MQQRRINLLEEKIALANEVIIKTSPPPVRHGCYCLNKINRPIIWTDGGFFGWFLYRVIICLFLAAGGMGERVGKEIPIYNDQIFSRHIFYAG